MLIERGEPERKQPKTITAEAYLGVLWIYNLGLARAGVEELQDKPSAAETDASQTYGCVQIPLEVTTEARAKRFTAILPRDRAPAILKKNNEAGRPMWTEGVRGPEAGMVIHQIMVERAQAWVWHEKPRERQPTAASQPPPATEFHL